MASRIGIGYTTFKRPAHRKLCEEQVDKTTKDIKGWKILHIYDDEIERRGIAYGKNDCLKALKDCAYIFLFDDDCIPVREGWIEFFIRVHKESGQHHFLYLKETPSINCMGIKEDIQIFNNCGGAFMFLTSKVLKIVGGFNKDYGTYGLEHAGYSDRIHKAGLTPFGAYLCPLGAEKYLYAMDTDFHMDFQKRVKHAPSMKEEINRVPFYIEQNRKVYEKDTEIYQEL